MSDASLLVFLATSCLIILSPGQDMMLVLSRSLTGGRRAGMVTATGVSVGLLGHTLLVTLGLGALLQTSAMAFMLLKYAGAAYLIYLGIRALIADPLDLSVGNTPSSAPTTYLRQGALCNLSNPKIAIFYFAYLPQFVSTGDASATETLLMLGCLFAVLTLVIKATIACMAGSASSWVQSSATVQRWLSRTSGGVFIAMGVQLAGEEANVG